MSRIAAQGAARVPGFRRAAVVDSGRAPIEIGIWYPARGTVASTPIGLAQQNIVGGAPIDGTALPLVLISHGIGGSLASHYDSALELARAGFVVAALTHPGDNSRDQRAAGNRRDLVERPRHVVRVLDYLLNEWTERDHLDRRRIGLLGASLGAFTALVVAGGVPNLALLREHCVALPDAPECRFVRDRHGDQLDSVAPPPAWAHDVRVRAIVVAAPALGFLFADGGLRQVSIPVQLWRAADDRDAPNAANSDVVRRELPDAPETHTVAGAGHFIFLPPCSAALATAAPAICHDPPDVDRAATHRELNAAIVRFFNDRLARQ